MDIKNIYTQLTNVDIDKQKQIWDERGKGYYGEYLLFCELYKSLTGNGKLLMNLNIPVSNSKTTEIDLILIHETGLYVFEIKHYKGTIYGKDTDTTWTQYFRTAKNNTFKNPIEQNKYHIQALKNLFPETPIFSCIVFTNYDCDIRVTNTNQEVDICKLSDINRTLQNRFTKSTNVFSMDNIDNVFSTLSAYSQMKEPIKIDDIEADFFSWVQPVILKLEEKKKEVEDEKKQLDLQHKKIKKAKVKRRISSVVFVILCIIISSAYCESTIQENNKELLELKQNFLHIDEIDNEYIDSLNSYVKISDISLSPLSDDAVSFTARVAMANDTYGILFTENSKYIVMTNAGKVIEYNVFGEHLFYNRFKNIIGTGIKSYVDLAKAQFFGISNIHDISYIKITGVELFKLDMNRTTVKDNLEIELYSK